MRPHPVGLFWMLVIGGCERPGEDSDDAEPDSRDGPTDTADSDSDSDSADETDTSDSPDTTETSDTHDTTDTTEVTVSVVAEDIAAMKLIGQEDDLYGGSLDMAAAGDVDGDGVIDLLVHLPWRSIDGGRGVYYVVSGSVRGNFDFGDVGTAIYHENDDYMFGATASSAGDVDGDGLDEVMVADVFFDDIPATATVAGGVLVFDAEAATELIPSDAKARIVGMESPNAGPVTIETGACLSPAGDTDGDGIPDLLVTSGNQGTGSSIGAVFLVAGPIESDRQLPDEAQLRLYPEEGRYLYGGRAAGDVDGDGLADIVAVQPDDDVGAVVIVAGGTAGDVLTSDADTVFNASTDDAIAGYGAHGIGDINEDGYGDIYVGDGRIDTGGTNAGAVAVHHGPFGTTEEIGTGDTSWIGAEYQSVAECIDAGDVDGDGRPDVAIAASEASKYGPGNVYIELGPIHSGVGDASDANVTIAGSDNDQFGYMLASAGDVDFDGLSDLYVSAPGDDDGGDQSGAVFLILGSSLR